VAFGRCIHVFKSYKNVCNRPGDGSWPVSQPQQCARDRFKHVDACKRQHTLPDTLQAQPNSIRTLVQSFRARHTQHTQRPVGMPHCRIHHPAKQTAWNELLDAYQALGNAQRTPGSNPEPHSNPPDPDASPCTCTCITQPLPPHPANTATHPCHTHHTSLVRTGRLWRGQRGRRTGQEHTKHTGQGGSGGDKP